MSSRLKGELVHPNRTGSIPVIRYSPDGKRIVAGDYPGGVVVIWDVETGKQLQAIETGYGLRGSAEYFFLSPDWQTLFVSRGKRKFERLEKDGKRLSRFEGNGEVRAWDLSTGALQKTYKHNPPRNIFGMNLSPDGKKFVTYDELSGVYERSPKRAASLWDVQTGEYRSLPEDLQSYGRFSPDGQTLAMDWVDEKGYSRAVKLFDSRTGQEKLSVAIKDKNAQHAIVGFSPDSRLMVDNCSVYDEAKKRDTSHAWLKWLDVITGREVASFPGEPKENFSNTRFSPDGQILAATNWQGEKTKLFLFSVSDKKLVKTIVLGEKKKGEWLSMTQPAFSPDGKWLAIITQVSPDTRADLDAHDIAQPRIRLIDVLAGEIRETLVAPQGFPWSPCFSPDGRTLATGGDGRVLLWDMTKLPGQTARVRE